MDMNLPNMDPSALTAARDDSKIESLRMMSLQNKKGKMSEKQMKDIAGQFETMMVRHLLKEMRKTVPNNGFIERSHATEMYMNIADDHLAEQLGQNQSLGIGNLIYDQLKEMNDKLASKEQLDEKSKFMDIEKPKENKPDKEFIPINEPSTERFIDINQNKPNMIPLEPKGNEYIPLGNRTSISTDQIEVK